MPQTSLTRVKRVNIKKQVFEQMRDQIVAGIWPPGTKIPSEKDLAIDLGVSRVSIREALQMLASLGLVKTKQGGGTYVIEYSSEVLLNPLFPMLALDGTGILEVLEYRSIMEKGTVALVVEKAGESEIAELEKAYKLMVELKNDVHGFAQADLEFHLALAKATGNPVIFKVNDIIKSILSASMDGIVSALGPSDGLSYHKRIIDAIKSRDRPLAENLMEEHILRTIQRLKAKSGNGAAGKGAVSGEGKKGTDRG